MKNFVGGIAFNERDGQSILSTLQSAGFEEENIFIVSQNPHVKAALHWAGQIRNFIDPEQVSAKEAQEYEKELQKGKTLILVKVHDQEEHDRAMIIFQFKEARDIKAKFEETESD